MGSILLANQMGLTTTGPTEWVSDFGYQRNAYQQVSALVNLQNMEKIHARAGEVFLWHIFFANPRQNTVIAGEAGYY